jgi:N-acyl-D-amino-acid deacylase
MHDLIIRGAHVYDGRGTPGFDADIAVDGDRIAAVGECGPGRRELDATNLSLAPGFIDVHTHDDFAAVLYPDMSFKVRGGVTTCVVEGYVDTLTHQPPSVNIGLLVGHGTLRMASMGRDRGVPTGAQMAHMKTLLDEGFAAGALGMSSGLIYEPGKHAQTEELIELAAAMPRNALYATHMRNEGTGLLGSVNEAIRIGEEAGVGVQISHHKASGHDAWGLVVESLKLIDAARARGLAVDADQYPYTAGSTILSAVLARDVDDMRSVRYEDIVIASTAGHDDWEGQSIPALAQQLQMTSEDAANHILAQEPGATVVLHSMDETDVQTVMRHPSTMIGSDGIPSLEGRPHPRLFGTFARVLGHYARDLGLFSLAEAVHRMTGFSAEKFGLTDRGIIREGALADLVLFEHTVDAGQQTSARAGRPLRRED